mgnify:FL=1|tara:strand:+ start:147 stop:2300 length:2154 start_codon:yes stop_codon:yes gene_type:complete
MKKLLLIKFALFLSFEILAQQGFQQSQDLIVRKNGVELINPWAGGANVPQFSPIDLNADNILDLMIFDKNGDQINCFINHGTEGVVDYHYAPEYNLKFPELEDWVLLRDYNCDNKMDIFTSYNGGIRVYKNTSIDEYLNFELIETIRTNRGSGPTNLYVSSVDIPHIGDIDYDGDLDILTFGVIGSHVEWHKNNSVENFGTCDSLNFELEDECWGDFSENFSNNSVTLYDCEKSKISANSIESRHSGSTLTALDLNDDSYFELLLGDITFDNIVMLENSASSEDAIMISQDTGFPNYSESVNLSRFPAAYYFDFDNDTKKDLIVAPNTNASVNFENIWFYKNQAADESVHLNLIARNVLLDQMIEVGSGAHPVFFDYNNDSLMDIIVANYGYYTENGNYNSQLALYENVGSHSNPKFEWVTDDFSDLGTLNFEYNIIPTFGDLDGDGDQDMIVGDSNGNVHLLNNIYFNSTSNFYIDAIEYFDIDVPGGFASPFLIDLDRDGDLDLIIGSRNGEIFHYNNEGSPSEASFVLANEQFGNINLTDPIYGTAFTTPTMIDGENGYELFVGTEKGAMYHYTNIDDNLEGSFEEISDTIILYSKGIRSAPAVYDLNNDGWNDMLLGIYTGGVHLLWGDNTDISIPETASNKIKIYPNPSEGIIQLDYPESLSNIEVYNIEGKLSFKGPAKKTIDLSHLESGFYFVKIRTKTNESLHSKICIY